MEHTATIAKWVTEGVGGAVGKVDLRQLDDGKSSRDVISDVVVRQGAATRSDSGTSDGGDDHSFYDVRSHVMAGGDTGMDKKDDNRNMKPNPNSKGGHEVKDQGEMVRDHIDRMHTNRIHKKDLHEHMAITRLLANKPT